MNPDIKRLFADYLKLTDDKAAAANLVIADALLSGRSPSEPGPLPPELESGGLSVAEAAKQLRCSPNTVYRLCQNGNLPHFRLGVGRGSIRIRVSDLEACHQICRSLPPDMSATRRKYLGL
ncbi:MAG: helix-turn-helix domain-containing protein [Pirellulales bacterium]|nr:helix-turn-helix domain-containing protein [Pirellulales bacterium]